MSTGCTFTVFTATYNRSHTLHRAYEGLQRQTFRDFEWLIVDDGSTDGTESLVQKWQREANFPIRYIWQPNGGKHTAHNLAIEEAYGRFFAPVDSDDSCAPQALEHLYYYWNSIPFAVQPEFSGVAVLARYADGQPVGGQFPADMIDTNHLEMVYRHRMRGDKWYCFRTSVLREFPYPVVDGRATHFNEATVYMRVARRYKMRYVNDPLLIVYADAGSLSRPTGSRRALNERIAATFVAHYRIMLNEQMDYAAVAPLYFLRAAAHYVRFSHYRSISPWQQMLALNTWPARLWWLAALPLGTAIYYLDRWWPLLGGAERTHPVAQAAVQQATRTE